MSELEFVSSHLKDNHTTSTAKASRGTLLLLKLWGALAPIALIGGIIVFFAGNFLAAFIWFPSLFGCLAASSFFGLRANKHGDANRARKLSRVPFFHPLLYLLILLIPIVVSGAIGQVIEMLNL